MAEKLGERARWRRRLAPVRVRTTLAAVVAVAVALAVGGVALVAAMRDALDDEVRTGARLRAEDVASVLESGTTPAELAVEDLEDQLIQVVDTDGRVVAASPNVVGEPAVARLAPGESAHVDVPVDDDAFVAVAVGADAPDGPLVVLVARTTDAVRESVNIVTQLLTVGLPALLVVLALVTWRVTGRALRPVEAMRAEVESISAAELHRRVPEPGTDDEVARLAGTMNEMLGRLEAAQRRQRQFVSDAAHELRSPVASIRQHAEVAVAHPEATSIDELGGTVRDEAVRVQHLVDDLLLLARADEHTLVRSRRYLDLDDLVLGEASRLRDAGHTVDTSGVRAVRVSGDERSLAAAVRNLVDNAGRHAAASVAIGLEQAGGDAVVTVDDDGAGVPEADRARVFDRFVRLDDARARDAGGSGLGLAIVREVAEAHGGGVRVSDGPLGGARFELRLPVAPEG